MKYFKTKNVHEKFQLLIKFYKNKNTAWYVNFRFSNQAGIIRKWLKLHIIYNNYIKTSNEEYNTLHLV